MERNEIKFSVIIVAYNIEKYIEEAIKSVLNQSYDDYEIIIIDDCSEDNTQEVINKYSSNEKVRIYKTKKNTGTAGGPRNLGIKYAQGEYILFLDGDDKLYNENVLLNISNLIGNNEYDLLYLSYQDLGNKNELRISNEQNTTKEARIICDVSFSVSSRCWNKKFLIDNDIKFIEGMYYEDEVFCMKANVLAKKTTYGEFPIFNYRRNRKGSVMSTPTIKKCSDWYRMLGELIDLINITPKQYRNQLLSFIKNESDSLPIRVKSILTALENDNGIPVFPRRNYKYIDFMGDKFEN